ncbi:hypothetical protein FHT78_005960 [Rhizobium sp. BK196]|jgi:hypothetical protein|uniref:3-keto-5-aminohexanoate cleavage protein n=1 Tax=unclassified Rhizobium TaxID=2613769 RepID=UPI0017ECE080|nr:MULTISPECIES: 3-keto-5-aminohexanoate cleavage protein [unclassified Rhizobium]MBB3314153.1 hypothetical protein [Rhizobium sp. BK196]MBB3464324.1 hypothetical protein [Rhizobium sp. BK377]
MDTKEPCTVCVAITGSLPQKSAAGIGRHQVTLNKRCTELGRHCRTGLEDNIRIGHLVQLLRQVTVTADEDCDLAATSDKAGYEPCGSPTLLDAVVANIACAGGGGDMGLPVPSPAK